MRRIRAALGLMAISPLILALASPSSGAPTSAAPPIGPPSAPTLSVTSVASGLSIPWDIAWIDKTRFLLTERPGQLWLGSTTPGTPLRRVNASFADLSPVAPGGLMGLAIDPGFAANRTFYTCQSHKAPNDVRVIRWRLAANGGSARRVGSPLIAGIPFRHSHFGCRLLVMPDGKLLVGTGDGAISTAPQALDNLAGKILRIGRDGSIPADNPWARSPGLRRYVWNYGHRNVQGLAMRPGTAQVFSAEHGPDYDDEVNLVTKAGNYGWNPVDPAAPGVYEQEVPMTDLAKYPKAIPAVWSSGFPTVATSGLGFVTGTAWGSYAGQALVAELKGSGVLTLGLDAAGRVISTGSIPELDDTYGRLRTLRQAPDGALYALTSNAAGMDQVLRITPQP